MAELDDLQNEVLRVIGRNILNLQKMEGMLKFIVSSTGKFDAAMDVTQPAKDLEKLLIRRRNAINRLPMGCLVELLSKTLKSADASDGEESSSENGIGFEISFYIEDQDFTDELIRALRRIVKERNGLVHKQLIFFNLKSVDSCRNLIGELDEQRARIKPQYEALSAICLSLRDYFKQLKDYADSGPFAEDLKRAEEQER